LSEAAIGVAIRSCPGVQPRRSYSRLHAIIADSASFANSADRFANNFASDKWAAGRELDSGEQVLFPIRIVPFEAVRKWTLFDADVGQDIAKYVRQYFLPDFSAWQDEEALARLTERFLRDLRLSQQSQPPK
jgi:hypothetical protein